MARLFRLLLVLGLISLPLTESASAQVLKSKHYFSEGINVPGWDTHFYVRNPTAIDHVVQMTVMGESRWPTAKQFNVPAGQTVGISMRNEFHWYQDTFATTFETVNNNGVGYLTVDRYVLRDGIGVLTHTNKDAPPTYYRTFAPCNPGAANTYVTIGNPYDYATYAMYSFGGAWASISIPAKSRKTVHSAGDPQVAVFNPNNTGLVVEKLTYNAAHTAAKICPGS